MPVAQAVSPGTTAASATAAKPARGFGPEEVELAPRRRHVKVDRALREGDAERDRVRYAAVVQGEHEVRGVVEHGPAPGGVRHGLLGPAHGCHVHRVRTDYTLKVSQTAYIRGA